jgi:hypothetical protein
LQFSIAGFDEAMYERVYRSKQYKRVRRNILDFLEANQRAGNPVNMVIGLRPDRPLDEVMAFPDFQEVLAHKPYPDFTWSFTSAGGRIKREDLPDVMKLRHELAESRLPEMRHVSQPGSLRPGRGPGAGPHQSCACGGRGGSPET